ncbi:MAG TPA: hypothetical protein VFB33_15335 [Candidatus Binataceae bacterium]|nr:hypothetical protein [Candidatus Binataceae bacterium]
MATSRGATNRGLSAKVVPIAHGRIAAHRGTPRRARAALGTPRLRAIRGGLRDAPSRVTPAWICIASLVAVTMWPSAAVLLAKLALRMFRG